MPNCRKFPQYHMSVGEQNLQHTEVGHWRRAMIGGAWSAIGYGFVGAPAGFIVNLSRRLFEGVPRRCSGRSTSVAR